MRLLNLRKKREMACERLSLHKCEVEEQEEWEESACDCSGREERERGLEEREQGEV